MSKPGMSGRLGLDRFSGLYLFAIIFVVFALWIPEAFLTSGNFSSIASQRSVVAMLALGLMVPMTAGAFDVSIGATINLSTVLVAVLITKHDWGMWPAMAVAVGSGTLVGVVNGFVVVKLKVNSFIGTLGMSSIIAAFMTIVSGQSQPSPPTGNAWINLTRREFFGIQVIVIYMLILAIVIWWFVEHTPGGRYLRAIGGNAEAARLSGVRVDRWTWISLIISGTVAGLAGVLYTSQNGPSLTYGPSLLLPAFAAVFLGSTQLQPGRMNVWGTVIAIYVLATGVKGLQLVTGVQWLNSMFNGVALIAAVAFSIWGSGRTSKSAATKHDPLIDSTPPVVSNPEATNEPDPHASQNA